MGRKIKSFRKWLEDVIRLTTDVNENGEVWGMDAELGTLDELVDRAMDIFFSKTKDKIKDITISKILMRPDVLLVFTYHAKKGTHLTSKEHNGIVDVMSKIKNKGPWWLNKTRTLFISECIHVEGIRDRIKWHKKELKRLEKKVK